jgi:hypothetical protein
MRAMLAINSQVSTFGSWLSARYLIVYFFYPYPLQMYTLTIVEEGCHEALVCMIVSTVLKLSTTRYFDISSWGVPQKCGGDIWKTFENIQQSML